MNFLFIGDGLMANSEVAQLQVGNQKITLKIGDLTREPADCIVNAANCHLIAGAGVCGAIHARAGDEVFQECKQILHDEGITAIDVGSARLTSAGNLERNGVKGIIHAVGPQGLNEEKLRSAYKTSLLLAENNGFQTIAFPSISTGIYHYPLDEAALTALDEIKLFLETDPEEVKEVIFVFLNPEVTGDQTVYAYQKALALLK